MDKPANCSWFRGPRGLFLRVFLLIGVGTLMAAMLGAAVFFIGARESLERAFGHDFSGLSDDIRAAIDKNSVRALQRQLRDERGVMLLIYHRNRPVGDPPPPWLMRRLGPPHRHDKRDRDQDRDRRREEGEESFDDSDDWEQHFGVMGGPLLHNGKRYRVLLVPNPEHYGGSGGYSVIIAVLMMLTAASGLVAWAITRPLRGIQRAARSLAGGDTGARVEDRIAERGDSIGDLGRDFNHMAGRVEDLLDSHRQLLRDVSHELRTPLARMQVALVLAQDTPAAAERSLSRIEDEIERLDALIESILTLARAEAGAVELDEQEFPLHAMLHEIARDAEYEYAARGLRAEVQAEPLQLRGDATRLRSAVENILRNAMRFSPDNATVSLSLRSCEQGIELRVRDRGPGVDADQLGRLFDAFYRSDSSRTTTSGGHGVGLAIARSIVELHGGRISAENAEGGGLCVRILLPRKRRPDGSH